jgi:hypothetical protein
MKAYIVEIRRFKYHKEHSAILILFGADRKAIIAGVTALGEEFSWVSIEPAPWMNKPVGSKAEGKGELVAAPQSLPVYVPAGYKLVPIHLSFTYQIAGRDALDETDPEASFSTDQVVACWDAILKQL